MFYDPGLGIPAGKAATHLFDYMQDVDKSGLSGALYYDQQEYPISYEELYGQIADSTGSLFQYHGQFKKEYRHRDTELAPKTLFGQVVKSVLSAEITYDHNHDPYSYVCCIEAEPKLVASINPLLMRMPRYKSPIIVTDNDVPVGIVKSRGERTFYGLEPREDLGIVEGAFESHARPGIFRPLSRSSRPWQVDISSLMPLQPLRLSTFLIEKTARRVLSYPGAALGTRSTLRYNHEDIKKRVAKILPYAQPIK